MTTYKEKVLDFLKRYPTLRFVDLLEFAEDERLIDECGVSGTIATEIDFSRAISELVDEKRVIKHINPAFADKHYWHNPVYKVVV